VKDSWLVVLERFSLQTFVTHTFVIYKKILLLPEVLVKTNGHMLFPLILENSTSLGTPCGRLFQQPIWKGSFSR
jgi:hypothetical protein